jgi:hypothetical protein
MFQSLPMTDRISLHKARLQILSTRSVGIGLAMGENEEDTGQGARKGRDAGGETHLFPPPSLHRELGLPANLHNLPANLHNPPANLHNTPATFTDHTRTRLVRLVPLKAQVCARDGKSNPTTCFHHYYIKCRPRWRAMLKTLPFMPVSGPSA